MPAVAQNGQSSMQKSHEGSVSGVPYVGHDHKCVPGIVRSAQIALPTAKCSQTSESLSWNVVEVTRHAARIAPATQSGDFPGLAKAPGRNANGWRING
ncbi:MAG TPA: hypothetical protein VI504_15175 [Candidatus Eisenbacteria bacterium]